MGGMAAEQEAPAPTRSPPHTYTIGYAMQPDKLDTVIQPSLVALAAERGMRLVAVDPSRPLVDQGPFHLLIHKLYDEAWRAQLEAFSAAHPAVPVVDPPAAIGRLLDRGSMLDVVSELNATVRVGSMGAPRQVAIDDAASLTDPAVVGALQFPLIAKPLDVDGSVSSHAMSLIYRRAGLAALQPPLVLQEFVNHGGVLFKIYVIGGHATCVRRRSLPDVPTERLLDLEGDASVPFHNVSSLTTVHADTDDDVGDDAEMPPPGFVEEVGRGLRRALGLQLFNFDMIRGRKAGGQYFIIDINYFPGFNKLPGYEIALTDFFDEMIRGAAAATRDEADGTQASNVV
ncbi:inositol-tetrakisphosphate 1-kinase 4-like [Triticum dicoccoides]|uniref:inositol-tetrakisphosphate 1-kinase 4-like n=1 Tax=Triticum dicoccoides TaxID=85692 RepID=UPI00162DB8B3|nr:inositol-tetrakisphosphate 1-kinase 4-like [Triticum dicoccoides]